MPAYAQLLVIVAAMIGFWAIVMRPARNQQKRVEQLQNELEVGQEVVLSAGIFGTVRALNEGRVELEVAPGTVLTVARQVVVRRVADIDGSAAPDRETPTTRHRPRHRPRHWPRPDHVGRPRRVGPDQGRGLRRNFTVAKKTPRPVRTLLIFGLAIVVLYGLAALGQTWKPRLGLDLEGGTRITLSAIDSGDAVTPTKLKQAAGIVDARVNGSGVSEAEVSTQGNRNIIVEIPGENRSDLVNSVKRTAQLRFRLVAGQPQPGTPEAQPKASDQSEPVGQPVRQGRLQEEGQAARGRQGHAETTPRPVRRHPDSGSRHRARGRPPRLPRIPLSSSPRSPRRALRSTSRCSGRRTRAWSGCRSSRSSPAHRRARTWPPRRTTPTSR